MSSRLTEIRERLRRHGQEHVLAFAESLAPAALEGLLDQLDAINFVELDGLIRSLVLEPPARAMPADIEPAPCYAIDPAEASAPWSRSRARAIGEELLAEGRVAAFTVAGGQGTRLGWAGPKGTFPATVVTGKPLFRVFAEQIVAARRRYGISIPWYIMTSPQNDDATRAFFSDNNWFALPAEDIFTFPQGTMPSIGLDGKLLLAAPGELATNPDGHGGAIRALRSSGAIEHMAARGIEIISYFQVDNPLVRIFDPVFLGLHAAAPDSSAEMSSKMVPKVAPEEKVGVFCRIGGRTTVVEYSDLPAALAAARDERGELRFRAGSIAIHAIGVRFVERLTADRDRFGLPFHRAEKKVPFVDPRSGALVESERPNAVKLETFVFDAIPLAASSIVCETDRVEEFAPIKNAEGVDSPASSHRLQTERHARWLEARGVRIPRSPDGTVDARIEIAPLTALEAADLEGVELPAQVAPGSDVVL
ncbi:MAG TPA: UDPGP type 1 family protein [Phycisphaerales bacterium]|nr:UDPGP type 1 family protein [Phycisphaerales bacterium]HMP36321.1 UDPGP type 1 family protein [Phycisphaerales bacterium]